MCIMHCTLSRVSSKLDKSVKNDENKKQISAGGCLISDKW